MNFNYLTRRRVNPADRGTAVPSCTFIENTILKKQALGKCIIIVRECIDNLVGVKPGKGIAVCRAGGTVDKLKTTEK